MLNREAEWQRLTELYASCSDDELKELDAEGEGLTDDAQVVLRRELQRRALVLNPVADSPEPVAESGNEGNSPIEKDDVELLMFQDMFYASKALDLLDEASIPFRLRTTRTENDSVRAGVDLMFVDVNARDEERAQALLRQKMGLFPLQEVPDEPEEADEALLPLAELETKTEAEEILRLLREAGIVGSIAPTGKDAEESDWFSVEVRKRDVQHALHVLEQGIHLDKQ